ncbi:epoxyqueuosine reductase [Lachnoclostridium sp.]|uniref:epoxyqueuosine reductase n=1 Tax=Lachnoclostridium sp. TaxID=2028282 RepID=UPI0028A1C039|nr:epoxyqueuosine reductase [Lachnoclostridium sp.]
MLINDMVELFKKQAGLLYGFADVSYCEYSTEYKTALVLAMPYENKLTLEMYSEMKLEQEIQNARQKLNSLLLELENVLRKNQSKYFIPPVAQRNETDLIAPFSFKYAAIQAGLGWIGKNDVLITKQYGPSNQKRSLSIEKLGRKNACGLCMVVCPYGIEAKNQ